MKSLQTDNMNGQQKIFVFMMWTAVLIGLVEPSKKEGRTAGLHIPEKIIGGVIDIVQSHKNKPIQGLQPTYPPNSQYNYQQYPQYQQWNGQSNFQNQGYQSQQQFQGTYPNQGQYYQNSYQGNFPQDGGNYNHGNPAVSGQTFIQGQNQQGQYQAGYQNPSQFVQPNNQFQHTQSGYYNGQSQSNQYQGSSTGFQGQYGQGQGQASGSGQFSQGQGFTVTGGQPGGNGQGPTCVCQAWTKPQPAQEVFADPPATEKTEKKEEAKP